MLDGHTRIQINGKTANTPQEFDRVLQEALEKRPTQVIRILRVDAAVDKLASIRQTWEEIAKSQGKELIDMNCDVECMLLDICQQFGFSSEETEKVLGYPESLILDEEIRLSPGSERMSISEPVFAETIS